MLLLINLSKVLKLQRMFISVNKIMNSKTDFIFSRCY